MVATDFVNKHISTMKERNFLVLFWPFTGPKTANLCFKYSVSIFGPGSVKLIREMMREKHRPGADVRERV